ncbi:hypothetical protein POM88_028851 [Heracleum sosnowskyi]|uniref:Protein TIC 20 n=1 Tax=Heracleum sosnowskyi TaxID=360622 RepID=A0AAD8HUP2_9APIA|nr:hypothetical protein POM88_028851 [Heracleum sosnowskyi]
MASLSLLRFSLPLHTPNPTRTPILTHPNPLRSTLHLPNPTHFSPHKPLKISASNTSTPVPDRLISSAAYFFPLFNGLQYGSFLFQQYPRILGPAIGPILPFFNLYRSVPYASYVAFLALYVGIVRNDRLSSLVHTVLGKTPYLPFVADAAGRQF